MEQTEKPKRGVSARALKWAFLGFNILMLIWFCSEWWALRTGNAKNAASDVFAGPAVSSGLFIISVMVIWLLGFIVLGGLMVLTRQRRR